MYKRQLPNKTTLKRNKSYVGETIEQKINRILNNKEPIKDGAPLLYTERKNGVNPDYNIRTDRFEAALTATDYISKSHLSKRQERIGEQAKKNMKKEEATETKPNEGTSANTSDNK